MVVVHFSLSISVEISISISTSASASISMSFSSLWFVWTTFRGVVSEIQIDKVLPPFRLIAFLMRLAWRKLFHPNINVKVQVKWQTFSNSNSNLNLTPCKSAHWFRSTTISLDNLRLNINKPHFYCSHATHNAMGNTLRLIGQTKQAAPFRVSSNLGCQEVGIWFWVFQFEFSFWSQFEFRIRVVPKLPV